MTANEFWLLRMMCEIQHPLMRLSVGLKQTWELIQCLFFPPFSLGLDQNQTGCLKITRPHNMFWPGLKHIVEQESRNWNAEGLVVFYRANAAHWKWKDEGGGPSPSLIYQAWLSQSSKEACKLRQHGGKEEPKVKNTVMKGKNKKKKQYNAPDSANTKIIK